MRAGKNTGETEQVRWPLECCPIRLSKEDSERLARLLLDPPEMTESLKEAFRAHRELVEPEGGDRETAPQA